MSDPVNAFQPALDALEKDLAGMERQGNELISAINILRAKSGLPPRPGITLGGGLPSQANGSAVQSEAPQPTQLRSDTFFGKRMGTAAREFLEMRRTQGLSAAKARDIFEGLKTGGFQFETKDDSIAIISVRNMLSKRTEMFQRLPNGTYGLKAWYPHAKTPKPSLAQEAEKGDDPQTVKSARSDADAASAAA